MRSMALVSHQRCTPCVEQWVVERHAMSYEVRIWCENGDCLGSANVEGPLFMVVNADRDSGYYWFEGEPFEHLTSAEAEEYARSWAYNYLQWLEEQCPCWTDGNPYAGSCGVLTQHGYSIQYCRDGFTVDYYG